MSILWVLILTRTGFLRDLFVYFRERASEHEQSGTEGRGGRQAASWLSAEPEVGLGLVTLDHADPKPRVGRVADWATLAPPD